MEYYVYIKTDENRSCPHFKELKEAIECFNENKMKKMNDDIFLGIEGTTSDTKEFFSFDVIHKMFGDNCLINDYINHESKEIADVVDSIIDALTIKYQFTSDILGGSLIDYSSPFVNSEAGTVHSDWNEVHVQTIKDGEISIAGWQDNNLETKEKYGWQYPEVYSYISAVNVTVTKDGQEHYIDMDPRQYLKACGKKFSICKAV